MRVGGLHGAGLGPVRSQAELAKDRAGYRGVWADGLHRGSAGCLGRSPQDALSPESRVLSCCPGTHVAACFPVAGTSCGRFLFHFTKSK